MSEPTLPDDAAVGPPERLHPLFLLTGLFGSVRAVGGAYVGLGYLVVSGRVGTALLAAAFLFVVSLIGAFIYWTRLEYRVGASEIRIDSGIISRTRRSIPFERIQDVDITQGPLARVLGIARVKFETGAAAGAAAEEGSLQAIALERAQELRALVRARRSDSPVAASDDAAQEAAPVYAMSLGRVLLSGVFNFSLALFAALFGATQTFGDVLGFDPLNRGFWRQLLSAGAPFAETVLEHRVLAAVAGLALLVLIGLATGMIRTLLRDYGFRLDRTEVGFRRRRGLLTRTDVTLPARRAQAAIIATGPLRRRFGWAELKLQSLAQDEGSADHVLAPLADAAEVETILSGLGWRSVPGDQPWLKIARAYIWIFAIAISPVVLLLGLQALVLAATPLLLHPAIRASILGEFAPLLVPTVLILLGLAAALLMRGLAWRRTGYWLDGDRLLVRTGWWRRRILILPLGRIQSIDLAESWLARLFGVASLVFGVAGGRAGGLRLPALPRETAFALREQLLV